MAVVELWKTFWSPTQLWLLLSARLLPAAENPTLRLNANPEVSKS